MENLLLTRIDDRLIHGQVMTAWMKVSPAKKILIIDNKVSKDIFMKEVLKAAAPDGVKVEIATEEEAIEILKEALSEPTFILVKTPLVLKELVDNGVQLSKINVGGMGKSAGRKSLYKNITATDEERAIFKELIDKGIDVEIQIVPAERIIKLKDIL